MRTGRNKILDWFEDQNLLAYKITNRKGDICAAYWFSKDDPAAATATQDEAMERLERSLKALDPGHYIITGRKNLNDVRNDMGEEFTIGSETDERPTKEDSTIGALDLNERLEGIKKQAKEEARAEMANMIKYHDMERENKELREKVHELERYQHDYDEKKLSLISTAIGAVKDQILPGIFGAKAVSPAAIGSADDEELTARLQKVVGEMREIEPDKWLDLLEGIVRIAKTDPATYNMAKNFLLK